MYRIANMPHAFPALKLPLSPSDTPYTGSTCHLVIAPNLIALFRLWILSCLSNDAVLTCRFEEARGALFKALGSRELFGVPLLVLANKQDLQDAQPPEAMQQMLGLDDLKQTFR